MRQWNLAFDLHSYGPEVAEILKMDEAGQRLIPLVSGVCSHSEAAQKLRSCKPSQLFPRSAAPDAAFAGLWLYFSCFDECHSIVQDLSSAEGSFWHGIVHRQEPDSGNAAYWFRRVGTHPIFRELCSAADQIVAKYPEAEFRTGGRWDPFAFIMFCERARQQPHSRQEQAALEIQRAEWQLLFDYCARAKP